MEITFLKDWLGLISVAIAVGTSIYAWITSRSSVNEKAILVLHEKYAVHEGRLRDLENEMRHMPAKDDVTELKITIAEMKGVIGKLDTTVEGVGRTVRRMEDFLMKDK